MQLAMAVAKQMKWHHTADSCTCNPCWHTMTSLNIHASVYLCNQSLLSKKGKPVGVGWEREGDRPGVWGGERGSGWGGKGWGRKGQDRRAGEQTGSYLKGIQQTSKGIIWHNGVLSYIHHLSITCLPSRSEQVCLELRLAPHAPSPGWKAFYYYYYYIQEDDMRMDGARHHCIPYAGAVGGGPRQPTFLCWSP